MKPRNVLLVFMAMMLVGCTAKAEQRSLIKTEMPQVPVEPAIIEEVIEDETAVNEETSEEEEEIEDQNNDSFSSESNERPSLPSKPSNDQPTKEEPEPVNEEPIKPVEPEPVIEVPVPQPDPPKPEPKPEVPKEEPKKTFVLPSNWTNGNEHNEYYMTTAEAAARVKALWDQKFDAGYSELYDVETNTTYAWVTWWE